MNINILYVVLSHLYRCSNTRITYLYLSIPNPLVLVVFETSREQVEDENVSSVFDSDFPHMVMAVSKNVPCESVSEGGTQALGKFHKASGKSA